MTIREVITPLKKQFTITVPETMVGKSIEITIKEKTTKTKRSKVKTIDDLKAELQGLTVSMKGYKFDRDEANDYE